jgi:hypothetical protein
MIDHAGGIPDSSPSAKERDATGLRILPGWYREPMARYRELLEHEHGWEVELGCPNCGATALPVFDGWTPSPAINFGSTPTIYSRLHCEHCGFDLQSTAGKKLVELFGSVSMPPAARRVLAFYILFMVLWTGAMTWGIVARWRHPQILLLPLILLGPLRMCTNWKIHSLRTQCGCGAPDYKFMGQLGRSYCYRCSSCSRLLRLRD